MRGVALSVLALAASSSFAVAKGDADKPVFKVSLGPAPCTRRTYLNIFVAH